MSDVSEQNQPGQPPQSDPAEKPTFSLEPAAPGPEPAGAPARPGRPSVLQLADDKCPNCGAKMDEDAVVCMACGYDMKANEVLRPRTGVDIVEPVPVKPDFVRPGGKPMVLVIAGACVTIAAMVAAAMNADRYVGGRGISLALALLVLYRMILHTGTGLAGLWCAARFVDHRLNRLDLAAARIFLAFSVFQLVKALHLPIENRYLEGGLRLPLAAAAYWVMLFILFRRSRQETALILLFHFGAFMFVELGVQLAAWLEATIAAAPGH